jgi:hypothetical protein
MLGWALQVSVLEDPHLRLLAARQRFVQVVREGHGLIFASICHDCLRPFPFACRACASCCCIVCAWAQVYQDSVCLLCCPPAVGFCHRGAKCAQSVKITTTAHAAFLDAQERTTAMAADMFEKAMAPSAPAQEQWSALALLFKPLTSPTTKVCCRCAVMILLAAEGKSCVTRENPALPDGMQCYVPVCSLWSCFVTHQDGVSLAKHENDSSANGRPQRAPAMALAEPLDCPHLPTGAWPSVALSAHRTESNAAAYNATNLGD